MAKSHFCGKAFNAAATVLAITSILVSSTLTSMIIPISENAFAYNRNQATSQTSGCGNDQVPSNIGCQNIGSSIQGDENAVNVIGQQQFPTRGVEPEPPGPPGVATLIVKKIVECVPDAQCLGLPEPEEFLITVTTSNDPQPDQVRGSAEGTPVPITAGGYSTDETRPEDPDGLDFVESELSTDCSGTVSAGSERECTITNKYEPEPGTTGTLIVRKIVQCLPEQQCPNLPDPDSGFLVFFASDTGGFGVQASEEGTPFRLLPGSYDASSEQIPPIPDGLLFVTLEGDDGCFNFRSGGPIQAGQERTCTITNTYRPE
jgi:hypothetical protein